VGKIVQIQLMLIWSVGTLLSADQYFTCTMGKGSDQQVLMVNYDTYEDQTKKYRRKIEDTLRKTSFLWVNSYYDIFLRSHFSPENSPFFKAFYQECAALMDRYDTRNVDRSKMPLATMNKEKFTEWLKSENFIGSSALGVMQALRENVRRHPELSLSLLGCLRNVDTNKIKITVRPDGSLLVEFDPIVYQQILNNMYVTAAYKDEQVKRAERKTSDACAARIQELQSLQKSMKKMILSALSSKIDAREQQIDRVAVDQLRDDLAAKKASFLQMSEALTQETVSKITELFQFHRQFHLPHMQKYAALKHDKILQRERRQERLKQDRQQLTDRYQGWLANVAGIEQQRTAIVDRFFESSVEMSSLLPVVALVDSASQADDGLSTQLRDRNIAVAVLQHQVGGLKKDLTTQQQREQLLVEQYQTDIRPLNTNLHAVTGELNRRLRELATQGTALVLEKMKRIGAERDTVAAQYYQRQAEQNLDDVMSRERYVQCPDCGVGLVAQNCEQGCCPGGLAVARYQ